MTDSDLIQTARQVIQTEAAAVSRMADALNDSFIKAARLIVSCSQNVLTTGVGKAGHIARKISATLSSTGTPSHFLSPADAAHGDLGSVRPGDIVLLLSASGETDEILRLLSLLKKLNHTVIAITAGPHTSLGKAADVTLSIGNIAEACPLGLAPSASTTAMLALGDALALSVMKAREFSRDDFALYHPAGQLGRKLMRVAEAMSFRLDLGNVPIAPQTLPVQDVLKVVSKIPRRPGATALVDAAGVLTGVFTDGDLRRLLAERPEALAWPVERVMTRSPKCVAASALAGVAMGIMQQYRIDELPVVDDTGKPVGMIDVQDLVMLKMLDVESRDS